MKHLKSYGDYIFESVMNLDDIYYKHYLNKMNRDVFKLIISYDPTSRPKKLGKYSKWLLGLYDVKKKNLEDFYKATEYLKLYDRFKHNIDIKDINQIKSLPELAKIIEPFEEPAPEFLSSEENKKKAFVKSFEEYDLYIPQTYEQSRDLGRGTKWCTAADSENGKELFSEYTSKGKLYILISKEDPKYKYQFHFEDMQFMDIYDSGIDLLKFLKYRPDVEKYFKPQMDEMMEYLNFSKYQTIKPHINFEKYPHTTFYVFKDEVILSLDEKHKYLRANSSKFMAILNLKFPGDYRLMLNFLKSIMIEYFNMEDFNWEGYHFDERADELFLWNVE